MILDVCGPNCIPCQTQSPDDIDDGPCSEYDEGGPGTTMDDGYPQCAACGYMATEHSSGAF